VSIDQAKAFDTIYHGFVREAYKFFGVGTKFLDMMDTIGTNRCATIILDDNSRTRNFNLGTGRPQGDGPSPCQFNAGEQILIFKIELDETIISIYSYSNIPRNFFPSDPEEIPINFRYESNCETDKVDDFADDVSDTTIMEINSLTNLKSTLTDFAAISGLKCNFNKSCILPIGTGTASEEIASLGFKIVDQLDLLGFKIDKNGLMCGIMFDNVFRKISTIITVWDRYRLSLPGRIGIYKTLLLSQISFIGSICKPDQQTLDRLQSLMINYVLGNLKVAKDRLYLPVHEGGLNLINLNSFLIGLQASWIKIAADSPRDNWRNDLRNLCC
jgi:Reverse transcriptase (RNA-dependent DNA polymerase)